MATASRSVRRHGLFTRLTLQWRVFRDARRLGFGLWAAWRAARKSA